MQTLLVIIGALVLAVFLPPVGIPALVIFIAIWTIDKAGRSGCAILLALALAAFVLFASMSYGGGI